MSLFSTLVLLSATLSPAAPQTPAPVRTNASAQVLPPLTDFDALLRSFQIKRGFRLELVAWEPMITDPVAIAFDERGRMFVAEFRAHPELPQGLYGRVRLLADTNGTGHYDTGLVFADKLDRPSALLCYGGGVYVATGSEILFLKASGDEAADVRQSVITCANVATNSSTRAVFTGLAWGLDHLIHVTTAGVGGETVTASATHATLTLTDGNFAFDPRTSQLIQESGSAPTGVIFDDYGHKFISTALDHLVAIMYEGRYARRNPWQALPPALQDVSQEGRATPIYGVPLAAPRALAMPVRPDNIPNRIPQTFTAAAGLTIYGGNAFPPEYAGNAFVADAMARLIHRDIVSPNGLEWIGQRAADEAGSEFLSSTDSSFQPVQVLNGPEGALYIVDWTAEAPAGGAVGAIPRGRIWRVMPSAFQPPRLVKWTAALTEDLVLGLRRPNAWDRGVAYRLLFEHQDKTAAGGLGKLLLDYRAQPRARLLALHSLAGLGLLSPPYLVQGFIDPDETVREHAVRLSELLILDNGTAPGGIVDQLLRLAGDPSLRVRFQVALTLGQLRDPRRNAALAEIIRRNPADRWIQAGVLSSLKEGALEMFSTVAGDSNLRTTEPGTEILRKLLWQICARNRREEVSATLPQIAGLADTRLAITLLRAASEGFQQTTNSLRKADANGSLQPLFTRVRRIAMDELAAEAPRAEAMAALGFTSFAENGEVLFGYLNVARPILLETAALQALSRFQDDRVPAGLMQRWGALPAWARAEAVDVLAKRSIWTTTLLSGLRSGGIARESVSSTTARFLEAHPDPRIRQQAQQLSGNGYRREANDRYAPSLRMVGNPMHGRSLFLARCGACHHLGQDGEFSARDLALAVKNGRESLLQKIMDPDRTPDPGSPCEYVQTREGEFLVGYVTQKTADRLTIHQATGETRTVPKFQITLSGALPGSAMPDGLEYGWGMQDMADLLEYLVSQAR